MLRLPQLRDDLCPTTFGALLLDWGIECTFQTSMTTILARHARHVHDAFDFAAVASIACSLGGYSRRIRHICGEQQAWSRLGISRRLMTEST